MTVDFLTPLAALVALAVVVPLAIALLVSRRAAGIRGTLRLPSPRLRSRAFPVVALVLAGALVGVAAAQPVLERTTPAHVRTDAEVYVVLDVSRSMLARSERSLAGADRAREVGRGRGPGAARRDQGRDRFADRPRPAAPLPERERGRVPGDHRAVDRDRPAAAAGTTVRERDDPRGARPRRDPQVLLADRRAPPARRRHRRRDPAAERGGGRGERWPRPPGIETVFVHVWGPSERVFVRGIAAPDYKPDPTSRASLDRLASATRGAVYSEDEVGAAAREARRRLGTGPTVVQRDRRERKPLAPLAALAAFLPLGLLLAAPAADYQLANKPLSKASYSPARSHQRRRRGTPDLARLRSSRAGRKHLQEGIHAYESCLALRRSACDHKPRRRACCNREAESFGCGHGGDRPRPGAGHPEQPDHPWQRVHDEPRHEPRACEWSALQPEGDPRSAALPG